MTNPLLMILFTLLVWCTGALIGYWFASISITEPTNERRDKSVDEIIADLKSLHSSVATPRGSGPEQD